LKKNNKVQSSYVDISKLSKSKSKKSELFDVLFILEMNISLKQKNNRNNELSLFQKRLEVLKEHLKLLKKDGSLYLEYFNCSFEKSLNLMVIVSSYFKSYKFISSKLSKNTLEGGFYVFNGFKGLKDGIFNYIYLEMNKIKNHKFVLFINNIQQTKYTNYNLFLKKCNYVKNSLKRKGMNYFINYQISLGVDWCNENNLSINNYYKNKLKRETTIHFLKKIFYPIVDLDYKKLKLYYDSFYSVTYVKDYNETLLVLQKYIDFNKEKVIVDACANVGVSTIALSYSFSKVYGVEISKERYKCLVNNINVYGRKNIQLICDDYLKIENKFVNDLVFFDPPWSGIFYKIENIMELYLGNTNIKECLKKQKKFILKAPFNYNYYDLKINNLIVEKLSSFLLIIRI
jgi:16S rRNA G966 N2-methylase RsmD